MKIWKSQISKVTSSTAAPSPLLLTPPKWNRPLHQRMIQYFNAWLGQDIYYRDARDFYRTEALSIPEKSGKTISFLGFLASVYEGNYMICLILLIIFDEQAKVPWSGIPTTHDLQALIKL